MSQRVASSAAALAISKTLVIEMPRLLELFSGTGSIGLAFKEIGWDVVSLDIDPKFTPSIAADVMDWDHTTYPPGHFDVVWASVPCTEYSRAKTIGVRKLDLADSIVERTLQLIDYFRPTYWWLENPASGLLHTRPCVQHLPKPYEVHYCAYGPPYRKPTHLWSNCPHFRPKLCNKRCWWFRDGKHLGSAQRGPNKGDMFKSFDLKTLYAIPGPLCDDIAWASSQGS